MSCRLLHLDGRPAFFGFGSSASSKAHRPSVRSNRLVTGTLATRSPEDRTSWSKNHLPETSPHIDHRHTDHQVSVRLLKHGLVPFRPTSGKLWPPDSGLATTSPKLSRSPRSWPVGRFPRS